MADKLEELKLAFEKAEKECEDAYKEYTNKISAKSNARREYEKELYKHENCGNCKYGVILDHSDISDHNICGCKDAPCTCCNAWCEYYQPDTPLTKAIKENLNCCIDLDAYEALKKFYGDILASKGSIDPKDGKEYSPIAKTLYDILKARYGEKAE